MKGLPETGTIPERDLHSGHCSELEAAIPRELDCKGGVAATGSAWAETFQPIECGVSRETDAFRAAASFPFRFDDDIVRASGATRAESRKTKGASLPGRRPARRPRGLPVESSVPSPMSSISSTTTLAARTGAAGLLFWLRARIAVAMDTALAVSPRSTAASICRQALSSLAAVSWFGMFVPAELPAAKSRVRVC